MVDSFAPRSALYVPGANPRAMAKAAGLDADILILDLEDSAAPALKVEAREAVCGALARGPLAARPVAVRVNGLESPWYNDDLKAVSAVRPRAIVLPKVESAASLQRLEDDLTRLGAGADLEIWAMIESPGAVLRAAQIAAHGGRLTTLLVGTADLATDIGIPHTPGREALLTSLALCVLAARAYGLAILDGIHPDIRDSEGLERACLQGRGLGFDGKSLIHPGQIEICNRCFSPNAEEVNKARRLIEVFEAALQGGRGVTTLDGELVEHLHYRQAKRLVAFAGAIAGRKVI